MITSDDIRMKFIRMPGNDAMVCAVCGHTEYHSFFDEKEWSHTVTDCLSNLYQDVQENTQ